MVENVWDKNGTLIKQINKCYSFSFNFIEATYFENKNYILLSCSDYDSETQKSFFYSKCYNYDEDDIKTYKCDDNNSVIYCINLFKKGNDIYLITGSNEKVNIFEFETTNLIKRIQIGEKSVNSLCSINEKYIIASNSLKLKIIDMEKFSVVKEYSEYFDEEEAAIMGIEKIKIPEKGEFIITYSNYSIKILKI
jgi:WD40 repeat protein